MLNTDALLQLMATELPSIGQQKKLCYKTTPDEVVKLYKLINKLVFDEKLTLPIIEVSPRCRNYWGICHGNYEKIPGKRSLCKIKLMDKWYCKQWLITILAHEMCHQYQWDVLGKQRELEGKDRLMSHGPSFYLYREKLAEHGIALKRHHGTKRWLRYQRFDKC